ncbi:MAG TPA: universal stress protein [Thermoanaerobaculia bacterium]|nr:universal stress protein [Thermoanaerobaculia bacterium]
MESDLKTIVIGTSLTRESDAVVRAGVEIARATGAAVRLVHARAPLPPYAGLPAELTVEGDWLENQKTVLRRELAQQALRTGLADLDRVEREPGVLAGGLPHEALVEMAEVTGAGLIVVGASEKGERRWKPLSSTADRVLRKAPCPVLVVRPESAFPPKRVVAPVDLSFVSAGALRYGLDLLAETGIEDAEVEVLFILNPIEAEGSLQFTPAQMARFAADELSRFVDGNTRDGGATLKRRVRTGYPWEEILKELDEQGADLAILGTHGHGRLERLLIGSVTSDVLREARCSVLAVPPTAALQEEAAQKITERARHSADWLFVADEVPAPV